MPHASPDDPVTPDVSTSAAFTEQGDCGSAQQWVEPTGDLDTAVPHSARIWNYWLGGKDNFEVDRDAGEAWRATDPTIVPLAREARAFLNRVVAYLAGPAGVHQFLDIGTGLPTANNTHEVAQAIAPSSRVIYVDNDPLVLAHARALLIGTPHGATQYIDADLTDTATVIKHAATVLDFDQPIALLIMGVLGHVPDLPAARRVITELLDPLPAGSYFALYDGTLPLHSDTRARVEKAAQDYADTGATPYFYRTGGQIASLFDGLDLIDPGIVRIPLWRPGTLPGEDVLPRLTPPDVPNLTGSDFPGAANPVDAFGGVARKTREEVNPRRRRNTG